MAFLRPYFAEDKSPVEIWQSELDRYQCDAIDSTADKNDDTGGCFCGYLRDRLVGDKAARVPTATTAGPSACYQGRACTPDMDYPCNNVELLSQMSLTALNAAHGQPFHELSDVWGWADPSGKLEVAIVGGYSGTSFVNVTDPTKPIYLGKLPTHSTSSDGSSWRGTYVDAPHTPSLLCVDARAVVQQTAFPLHIDCIKKRHQSHRKPCADRFGTI
jgi:hypothetical protein